jgi:FkbM family methyltransferase
MACQKAADPGTLQHVLSLMLLSKLNQLTIWQRKVKVFEHVFRAPTLDRLVSLTLHKLGFLGRDEVEILRCLVRAGMTAIDIGANQGVYTLFLAGQVRPGKVYAFEPHPMLYRQLVANIRENRIANVECDQIAVSSSPELLTLQLGYLNLGDNYIARASAEAGVTVQVRAATLDELFEGTKVDLLKIDVQGWEAAALAGACNVLKNNQEIALVFEFWPFGLKRAGADPAELLSYLSKLGFSIYGIGRSRLLPLAEIRLPDPRKQFGYCNLVALRDPGRFPELLAPEASKKKHKFSARRMGRSQQPEIVAYSPAVYVQTTTHPNGCYRGPAQARRLGSSRNRISDES